MPKPFLFAIVDPHGAPHMSEYMVCVDREPLDEIAQQLNLDQVFTASEGYCVIALYPGTRGRHMIQKRATKERAKDA
jgi:hypothetical protein